MANIRTPGSLVLSPNAKKRRSMNATPASRRQSLSSALITSSPSELMFDGSANNDEIEKKERQLNRLHQLKTKSSSTTPSSEKRKSLNAFAGLTSQQVADHYAKCIQLSTENKINVKNAFNLQLIDCMTELLKKKDSDMNNFQMASCTLDASTKIYGYRVDSVHADTLKMAGGLGRTKEKHEEENSEEPGVKKKTRARRCVVETNLKNLNIAHFNLEFDVDPLFKKMAFQFNDGTGGGSQFLNTLHLLDDECALVLDSETVVWEMKKENEETISSTTIPSIPDRPDWLICPTFAPFEFSSWSVTDEDKFDFSKMHNEEEDEHAFDINAVPEPLEPDLEDPVDFDGLVDNGMGDDDETVMTVGAGACRQGPLPPPPQFEIVHLKDHLANAPLEYSYFDHKVMSAWAGPRHWKFKSFPKAVNKDEQKSRGRIKKDFKLSYEHDELEKHFAVLRAATKLTQTTIKRWSDHATTLPVDLHYDHAKFSRLYLKAEIVVRKQEPEKTADVEDSIVEYEYDNQNDNENYCPPSADGDNSGNYNEFTFNQTVMPSQPTFVDDQMDSQTLNFLGNNLVQAPNKVNLISIGYARTAKKVDMKRLKNTLWTMLCEDDTNKENQSVNLTKEKCVQKKSFAKIYEDLRPRVPAKMADDLSVPLAFIALLHLANEHSLKLSSAQEMGDFVILSD